MTDAKERLFFINEVRKAVRYDHNQRANQKLEPKRFNRGVFESELYRLYPQVGNSELLATARKSVIALEKNPDKNWGMDFDKVDGLMKYLFTELDPTHYPTMVKVVKEYAGGEFAHYAKMVRDEETIRLRQIADAFSGKTGKSDTLKIAELLVKQLVREYDENAQKMQEDKDKIERLQEREKEILRRLEAIYRRLSNKKSLTDEDRAELERLKNLF